jgi:hypothetical protein
MPRLDAFPHKGCLPPQALIRHFHLGRQQAAAAGAAGFDSIVRITISLVPEDGTRLSLTPSGLSDGGQNSELN